MTTRALDGTAAAPSTRLLSLDVFRGFTMAAMVIVNNPGDWSNVYAPLLHADWHGWTPTDLIFPFFLFIVGVSITLSRRSTNWSSIFRRAAIIFALGLFLAGYPHFELSTLRIPGVLQRIAICYLIAAAVYKLTGAGDLPEGAVRSSGPASVVGAAAAALLILYWVLLTFVPTPGGTARDLSPEGNLGAWIDRALMKGHLWRPGWDPEGLLSTIPAISTTLLGVLAGRWLRAPQPASRTGIGLATAGALATTLGLAWDVVFPINKNLWTSSYAVFTAGLAALLLAGTYWAVDVKGWRRWTGPFVVLGTNAIALYVVSGLIAKTLSVIRIDVDGRSIALGRHVYTTYFLPLAPPKNASLLYACANLIVLFALLAWMYRRRWFLRV